MPTSIWIVLCVAWRNTKVRRFERLRDASRRAFENLVDFALERGVAFMLIAGDLFDGDWEDFGTGLYFNSQIARLRQVGIRVFVVHGNHDAMTSISRHLIWPENVHVFPCGNAETIHLDEWKTAVHGISYEHRAESRNLASMFPERVVGAFNIGLLHTSLDGRAGHEPYAPCTIDDLTSKGYDYWALGHVHRREEVRTGEPWVVFPVIFKDDTFTNKAKKVARWFVSKRTVRLPVEAIQLDVVRWKSLEIPWETDNQDDLLERVGHRIEGEISHISDRLLALRLIFTGSDLSLLDQHVRSSQLLQQLRAVAADRGGGQVWLKDLRFVSSDSEKMPRWRLEKENGSGSFASANPVFS